MLLALHCCALATALQEPMLLLAQTAARAAGRHMISRLGACVEATKLDSADLVTAVDAECQEIVERHIRERYPTHALLGEESVAPGIEAAMDALRVSSAASEYLWIIDPVDGTTNFVAGLPLCAVSVGLTRRGERLAGVVYDPFRDELFSAWRGEGATLNGAPMRASGSASLSEAVLCACAPHNPAAMRPALRSIEAVMPVARSVRILGSGVLNFAWVACGRLDAYWEPELAPWDSAAGTLLVEEAGGCVSDMDGSPYRLRTRAVLGSAPGVHVELQRLLEGALATRSEDLEGA